MASPDGAHCNDLTDRGIVGTAPGSYQLTVISHDVVLHPCGGLELLPAVLTGEQLLCKDRAEPSHTRHSHRQRKSIRKRNCCWRSPVCSSPCASSVPPLSFCTHFYIWGRSLCLWPQSGAANAPPGSLEDGTKEEKGITRF